MPVPVTTPTALAETMKPPTRGCAALLTLILLAGTCAAIAQVAADQQVPGTDGLPDAPTAAVRPIAPSGVEPTCSPEACPSAGTEICCRPSTAAFDRFLRSTASHALTPRQKLELAGRNAIDPFNALTILGTSAIAIASDPDSAYGPGLKGFVKNSAVVYTEGLTSEFFGTFLIPSLARQDPHYHRMPNASTRRRMAHAFYQVVWTQGDSGRTMFNYATVFGTIADDAVNDLYVPGRKLGVGASAARIGTAIGTDPIDNFITEFVPDLARRIKFHVVFVQRIINQVALEEGRNAGD